MIPPTITYGFQETHTTICSYLNFFTCRNIEYDADNTTLRLRLNNPGLRPESYSTTIAYTAPGVATTSQGFSERMKSVDSDDLTYRFPIDPGASNANGGPVWSYWETWSQMYQMYAIIKVHYKLTIYHPRSGSNNGVLVITCEESNTSGDNSGNRTAQGGNVYEYLGLKQHKKYRVGPGSNDGGDSGAYTVIEGTYTPGSIKRNVVNDSDVRTWISTSSASGTDLIDTLFIAFFRDPLSGTTRKQHVNCQLEMKAVVQFKDLKEGFRYPANQAVSTIITNPADMRHYEIPLSKLAKTKDFGGAAVAAGQDASTAGKEALIIKPSQIGICDKNIPASDFNDVIVNNSASVS